MKRNSLYILGVIMMTGIMVSGCAQFSEKFIPKPKKKETVARRYHVVRPYDVHPSLELYTKRYVFWKNWHKELLAVLRDQNHKKKVVAVEHEISNLMDMRDMLVDEKGDELQVQIEKLQKIEKAIKKERITSGNEVRIRRRIELVGKKVKRDFTYRKMRGFIRDDFRREESS